MKIRTPAPRRGPACLGRAPLRSVVVAVGLFGLLSAAHAQPQPSLDCAVDRSVGLEYDGSAWADAPAPNTDAFRLEPAPGPTCENDDFTCQARNPNYRLTAGALQGDFVGCYRPAGLPTMQCPVFTSVLLVNFDRGVFALLDDGGLISSDEPGGSVHLRVGKCVPAPP